MTHPVTAFRELRVTESARERRAAPGGGTAVHPRLRDVPLAASAACFALLVGSYLGHVALAGASTPLLRADAPFGVDVVFRMNLVMIAIIAYTVGVGLIEFRTAPQHLGRLRQLLDCDDATFASAVEASLPTRLQVALALAAGGLVGGLMSWTSFALIAHTGRRLAWDQHDTWNVGLLILLFALLGLLALWGTRSALLYSSLSRRYARVRLLDEAPLQVFAARGLRLALFWFAGSGIALLLLAGARAQEVVFGGIALTVAIGLASLVLPSLGIHQRMREVKAAELARVRGEIGARVAALRNGDAASAAELPALLSWEARVAEVREWPLGGGVLIRFGLLVLIPLGSWLGGALVERLVDAALG